MRTLNVPERGRKKAPVEDRLGLKRRDAEVFRHWNPIGDHIMSIF
jgi:hypothetical protein